VTLTAQEQNEFLKRGFTRRNLGKIAAMITAGTTLTFYNEIALAQASKIDNAPADAVMINANENPMGPCPEAAEAIRNVVQKGGRYMYGLTDELAKTMAQLEGVKPVSGSCRQNCKRGIDPKVHWCDGRKLEGGVVTPNADASPKVGQLL